MAGQSLLERKVGQLLIVGTPGTVLETNAAKSLGRVAPGGVILFKENYESVTQLVGLTNAIQKVATLESFEGLPAWIAVDQEGGRVQRFRTTFTQFPPAAEWGKLNSPKTAFEAGYVMGRELRACGVNVNFAPVCDIPINLDEKVIGNRAFSSDPEVVETLASATARGLQKGGVLSVLKHFPGHGVVDIDTHLELPTSSKSIEELESHDWIPFKRAIRSRAEGVMTAHILFPKIDPDRPATLSRKFLQDHLRKSLRHQKLIFSDDLEMGAIQKKYTLKDAAFLAIEAGCDQILLCHEYNQIEDVWAYLVKAFDTGALNIKKLDESLERIKDAKRRFLSPFQFTNADLAQAIVGAPEFLSVAQSIRDGKTVEAGPSTRETSAH